MGRGLRGKATATVAPTRGATRRQSNPLNGARWQPAGALNTASRLSVYKAKLAPNTLTPAQRSSVGLAASLDLGRLEKISLPKRGQLREAARAPLAGLV
jgi:hypothetical protein